MFELKKKEYINPNLFKVFFDKKGLNFIPGQHFSLSIPGKSINREYSSYTSPDEEEIGFLIRRVEGGIMTNYLDQMKIGEPLNIYGPYGSFTLSEKQIDNKKIIFIASGTGIAPFVSIKKKYNIKDYEVFIGIRHKEDIVDSNIFDPSKSYFCISRDKKSEKNNHYLGRLNDQINKIEYLNNYEDAIYMICGNSFMISDIYDILVNDKKIHPNQILTESFF